MLLFLDIETTGKLSPDLQLLPSHLPRWPRMVAVAWSFIQTDRTCVKEQYAVIKPEGFLIPQDAVNVHGITTEAALRDGKMIREILNELVIDIKNLSPQTIVAHNIDFDLPIILAELMRAELDISMQGLSTFCTMKEGTNICKIYRHGKYKWPTLQELYGTLFSSAFDGAHNAQADLKACVKCYFGLKDLIANREDERSEAYSMIEAIQDWAIDHDSFDTSFVDSCAEQLDDDRYLSTKQMQALRNICDKFYIDY